MRASYWRRHTRFLDAVNRHANTWRKEPGAQRLSPTDKARGWGWAERCALPRHRTTKVNSPFTAGGSSPPTTKPTTAPETSRRRRPRSPRAACLCCPRLVPREIALRGPYTRIGGDRPVRLEYSLRVRAPPGRDGPGPNAKVSRVRFSKYRHCPGGQEARRLGAQAADSNVDAPGAQRRRSEDGLETG